MFKEAAEAYEVLSNEDNRARFDRYGHEGLRGGQDYHSYSNINDIFSNFWRLFSAEAEAVFLRNFSYGRFRGGRQRSTGELGSDIRINTYSFS